MADTAALVVALSAQLTKFEKDMSQAVAIADSKTKQIETTFTRVNLSINNQLSNVALGFATRLGIFGNVLQAIGPIGVGVAASLGAVAASLIFITDKVDKFAQKASALKEFSDTIGLTVEALKALSIVGQQVGLDSDQTERGITKLAIAVQNLNKGSGPLFDALLEINPQLIRQISAAKDLQQAIDILSNAYKNLNQQQQLQISTAVGGARNTAIGRVLGGLPQGGLTQAAQDALDKGFSPDLIARVEKLRQEIEAIQKRTDTIWGQAFSIPILNAQRQSAEFWLQIAQSVERAAKGASPGLADFWTRVSRGAQKALDAGKTKEAEPSFAQRFAPAVSLPAAIPKEDAEATAARLKRIDTLTTEIGIIKSWTTSVQNALTPEERLNLAKKEAELQGLKNVEVGNLETRMVNEFTLQERQAVEALRERLGIATEQEISAARLEKLEDDARTRGLSRNEVLRATNVILKESKELAEQLEVRRSYLPGLKQLQLDAANVAKGMDQLGVSAFNTLGDGFADIILKTRSLSEAFKQMTDSILRDLLRLIFRQTITGPLAGILANLGGTAFAPGGAIGGIGHAQHGGPVRAGSPYVVGEHGPELFVPQSSGHIVPNAISGGKTAGGTSVEINNFVAADTETKQTRQEGPTGDRVIIDIVKKAQARGELDDVNRGRFGLRPAKVR